MLFRVGLVTLLLASALVAEVGAGADEQTSPIVSDAVLRSSSPPTGSPSSSRWCCRASGTSADWLACRSAPTWRSTTILVHLTGGAESAFAFMYILVIVGAAFVLGRGALVAAAAAVLLYVGRWCRRVGRCRCARSFARWRSTPWPSLRRGRWRRGWRPSCVAPASTSHRRALKLRDLAALHEDVIRGLTSGLVTVGRDGRVLTFNAAAAEIVGRDAGGGDRPAARRDHARAGGAAGVGAATARFGAARSRSWSPAAHDARTLGVSLSPLVDSNGRTVGRIVNFQDLTELRRMEVAMQRAERLAAVGRLAAGIAHEIRNPLAAISGSIELLASDGRSRGAQPARTGS